MCGLNQAGEDYLRHLSDPGLIKGRVAGKACVFIDEVQRIPSILNTVQVLLDSNPQQLFWLTGSSARKLKRGQTNLLLGRLISYELGPLTHGELGKHFDPQKALARGLLPGIYWEPDPELAQKILRTYAATYLTEEVQAEALTRNLEGFSRFFQIIAARSGDYLDYSKFASEAMIDRSSARRYFDILVDTLIVVPVPAFSKSPRTRLVQHPKYYFFDTGVLNGSLNNFEVSADRKGKLFAHLFLQLLLSSAKAMDHTLRVSTFRTEAGAEVDFIVERGEHVFAVELKASKNVGAHELAGLRSFAAFFQKPHQPLVVYQGADGYELNGVPVRTLTGGLALVGY